jgi:hypothetical protein
MALAAAGVFVALAGTGSAVAGLAAVLFNRVHQVSHFRFPLCCEFISSASGAFKGADARPAKTLQSIRDVGFAIYWADAASVLKKR